MWEGVAMKTIEGSNQMGWQINTGFKLGSFVTSNHQYYAGQICKILEIDWFLEQVLVQTEMGPACFAFHEVVSSGLANKVGMCL